MRQIAEDIKQNNFKQIYLLYGEERYLRRQYRQKLQAALCSDGDTMNVHFYSGKDVPVGEIIDLAETLPFLAERRVIFISDSGLFKSGGEKLAEYLTSPCESTYFVFTESEVDKRSKLFKTVQSKGYAADFTVQDENTLKRWIAGTLGRDGKKITENTVQLIISKTGTDMDNIQMELEKLFSYAIDRDVITQEDVQEVGSAQAESQIFDMLDAIGNQNREKALKLYHDLLEVREPAMRILYLLTRQINILLQVSEMVRLGMDNSSIAGKAGIPPFTVGKYKSQIGHFSYTQLLQMLESCQSTDAGIKRGLYQDIVGVELLIVAFSTNSR